MATVDQSDKIYLDTNVSVVDFCNKTIFIQIVHANKLQIFVYSWVLLYHTTKKYSDEIILL